MLTLYIISAVVAGVLIVFSLLGAEHGADHDVHFDHEAHLEHDHDHDSGGGHSLWLPFFSLRFYTYFFAGLGATGLLIHYLTATAPMTTLYLSIGVGLVGGFAVSIMVRMLRMNESTSASNEKDVLGLEAQVLVAIRGKSPGRIRAIVKGEAIDFLAICDDSEPIKLGATVIVVAFEEGRALVIPRTVIFSDDSVPLRTS